MDSYHGYLGFQAKLDQMWSVETCKNYGKNLDKVYLKEANKILRKHKDKNMGIVIADVRDMKKAGVICYRDATELV